MFDKFRKFGKINKNNNVDKLVNSENFTKIENNNPKIVRFNRLKMFGKNVLKKLVFTAIFVGFVAVLLLVRNFNQNRESLAVLPLSPPPIAVNSTILQGNGFVPVLENDNFILSLDLDSGNIEMYDKQANYTWRSVPSAEEMALEEGNQLWLGNLQSPLMLTITDNLLGVSTNLANIHNQNVTITARLLDSPNEQDEQDERDEKSVEVNFSFDNLNIELAYNLTLTNDGFILEIVWVNDNNESPFLVDFTVFPFMGATHGNSEIDGYLFLPDGPGGLVQFNSNRGFNHSFIQPIFGRDFAFTTDSTITTVVENGQFAEPIVNFPVFGINRNNNALMAVVQAGEADIIGNPAMVQTGFNSAYARFVYRRSYRVLTNAQTNEGFFRFAETPVLSTFIDIATFSPLATIENNSIRYYFLHNAGWLQMAQNYRDYLAERYNLQRLQPLQTGQTGQTGQRIPFTLNIIGGDMAGSAFVPLTTFNQAENIASFLHENGITNANLIIHGWQRRGNSVRSPQKYPIPRQLGGASGLNNFMQHAQNLGYSVILADNFSTIQQTGNGIRLRRDTVFNAQGFPLFGGWHLTSTASEQMLQREQNRLSNANGILLQNLFALSDFNPNEPKNRATSMQNNRNFVQNLQQIIQNSQSIQDIQNAQNLQIFLESPQTYLLQNGIAVKNMPIGGTNLIVIDETVPFLPIAFHGYTPFFGEIYNRISSVDMLRALAVGALPSFELVFAEDFRQLDNTILFSSQFDRRASEFVAVYNRFSEVYSQIQGKIIKFYREIDGVIEVHFEGEILYVNLNQAEIMHNGRVIPPQDFLLIQ
ncbi:MAG: DUF5696 domain-containing protein [Firmicutes bacterium]|nr:DUF5696 domain-containing protein [Bacillota bacterium]